MKILKPKPFLLLIIFIALSLPAINHSLYSSEALFTKKLSIMFQDPLNVDKKSKGPYTAQLMIMGEMGNDFYPITINVDGHVQTVDMSPNRALMQQFDQYIDILGCGDKCKVNKVTDQSKLLKVSKNKQGDQVIWRIYPK